jgi:hypothetical protein
MGVPYSTHTIVTRTRVINQMGWKQGYFSSKPSPSIGVQRGNWKNIFIKCDIPRDIDTTSSNIKTFKPFVLVTVTKESTLFRSELKFVAVEGTQIGPT